MAHLRGVAAAVLALLATAWAAGIGAAPLVRGAVDGNGAAQMAALTYAAGALVCHQRPDRSFHVAGVQLPVCARCAALYWSGAAGLIGWLLIRSRVGRHTTRTRFRRWLIILGVPAAVTYLAAIAGVWDPSNVIRAMSSAPLGVGLGAALAAVTLEDLR